MSCDISVAPLSLHLQRAGTPDHSSLALLLHCIAQHQVGTFEVGKEFDALVINVNVPGGPFDVFDGGGSSHLPSYLTKDISRQAIH